MSISLGRVTYGVTFDKGIRDADWSDKPVGQTAGGTQQSLLPGETTVTEHLANVFPKDPTAAGAIAKALAQAGSALALRTGPGFRSAASQTARTLRGKGSPKAQAAAEEIEALLADTELLDMYRAALLES